MALRLPSLQRKDKIVEEDGTPAFSFHQFWQTLIKRVNLLTFPSTEVEPNNVGEMSFELTSDTSLTVKVKGSDGIVRSNVLTLS